ncbi:MAG: AraC family ligand binding domain-containing protein [Lachnospiraceae bacterium]|nr:AraC family ligand binding domain-containing protein [Lachnospiraceae bacterium]
MPEKEYVYKSEHCRYLGLTHSKRQNESLYLMCCGIEKCHPGYFFATADRPGYHFHVVLSGQGTLEVEGNASTVRAGQIFVTKPMERTRYQADMETPWTYCWVTFGGEKAIYYLEQAGLRTGVNIRDCRTNPSNFLELISKLMEKPELQLSSDLWRLGILYQFLGLAVKTGTPDKENHNQEYDPDTYVKHGMEYIRHNFASMKIGDVPRSIGIDRSYFTKLFSKKIGVSPREYLILVRMREGARLLSDTDLSVEEIALRTGYGSLQAFSRIFKQNYQCAPVDYRRAPREARTHLRYPNGELFALDE